MDAFGDVAVLQPVLTGPGLLIDGAPRVAGHRGWVLDRAAPSDHDCSVRALGDLDVLVVDCQATGASPAFGHVLELGWAVVRASAAAAPRSEAHWIALPEGHVVPAEVRRLTGWQPADAAQSMPDVEA